MLAQQHAQGLGHNYIGTEHLLLGLISNPGSVAAAVLADAGVSFDAVRRDVEERIGQGGHVGGHIPFTPRAKSVFEQALRQALLLETKEIRSPHLLLGILHDPSGVACQTLDTLGVDLQRLALTCRERADEPEAVAPGERAEPVHMRVSASATAAATPVRSMSAAPFCPRCEAPMRGNLGHDVLEVEAGGAGRRIGLRVVYCRSCGTPIETEFVER